MIYTDREDSVSTHTVRVGNAPLLVAATVPAFVLLAYASAGQPIGFIPAFLPATLAVAWTCDALTAFLLATQFLVRGSPRLLALALAYLWSAAVLLPYGLVFPGLFSTAGLLGASPSSAPWLWTAWHLGFPLLIGFALAPWPPHPIAPLLSSARARSLAAAGGAVAVIAAATAVTWLVTAQATHLPVIMRAGSYATLTQRFGVEIITINVLAVIAGAAGLLTRRAHGLEAWAFVAVCASLGDAVLTLFARSRFTVGWYGARMLGLLAAIVVLTNLLSRITLLYQRVSRTSDELAHRNEQLQAANAVREHVLAVVSHELRSPLTTVRGFLELHAGNRAHDPHAQLDDAALAHMQAATGRMCMLTEDLLTATTSDHDQLHMTPASVDLHAALLGCAASFPDAHITAHCRDDVNVWADPMRLEQMISNYLRNAVKYGAPPIELVGNPNSQGTVDITVHDHGPGVPAEFIPELFDRFTRAPQTTATNTEGLGLGLSIVASLATASQGRAWYDTTSPTGARFVITLPASRGKPDITPANPAVSTPNRHGQTLTHEDLARPAGWGATRR